jgi:nitrogen-specific signal transduction histidine kinase
MPMPSFVCWIAQNGHISAWQVSNPGLADRLHNQRFGREGTNMALSKEGLLQELKHQIHSPLAAVRNAPYLTAIRINDPETQRYLVLADAELVRIAAVLKNADQIGENKRVQAPILFLDAASAA